MVDQRQFVHEDVGRRVGGSRGRPFAGQRIPGRATHHDVIAQLRSAIQLGSLRFAGAEILAHQRRRRLAVHEPSFDSSVHGEHEYDQSDERDDEFGEQTSPA